LLGFCRSSSRTDRADGIVIDAKSGVHWRRTNGRAEYLFAEVDDNLRAYKIGQHRTLPRSSSSSAYLGPSSR
jgi:N-acetyl-gamma-glutamylphosphate reductase